jgi:gamma-glutamylcyclotransferase (GGCT)/AIG2-like uncharacterized protein YtfP
MGEGRERIFLYGTLRREGSRDVRKFYGGAEFVAPAKVRGVLHDFDQYPGLRLAGDAGWVIGELFDVTPGTLTQLDEWEGIDPSVPDAGEYRRVRLVAEREDGAAKECWGYEIAREKCVDRPVISSGDWIAYAAARS